MKITAIEKAKGDRYTVFVDGEYWYILDLEIILQNSLKPGTELEEEQLDDLKRQAERRTARERAYYLLGYRDHSRKELADKLLKSACPDVVEEILHLVESQGYLNDEAYAGKLARYCLESKHWGARRAMAELLRRGIDRETAQNAIEGCDTNPVAQIRAVIDRKYYGSLADGDYKSRQKVIAALMRLGYGYGDIKQAISEYSSREEDEDESAWSEYE